MNKKEISNLKVGDYVWEVYDFERYSKNSGRCVEVGIRRGRVIKLEEIPEDEREFCLRDDQTHAITLDTGTPYPLLLPSRIVQTSSEGALRVALDLNKWELTRIRRALRKLGGIVEKNKRALERIRKTGKKVVRRSSGEGAHGKQGRSG